MANVPEILMSKGSFARLLNVSPSRVSQMITEGKIGSDALEGDGRFAKIRANLARRQISDRTDVGQRFGNGLGTLLEGHNPLEDAARSQGDDLTEQIKRERLRTLQMANERSAGERLADQGRFALASDVQAAMRKLVQSLVTGFEGGLVDMATAIAAEYRLPQRDVLHLLRTEFRAVRARMAAMATLAAEDLPRMLQIDVPDEDPGAGS